MESTREILWSFSNSEFSETYYPPRPGCPRTARRRCVMTSQGSSGRSPAYGRLSVITWCGPTTQDKPRLPNLMRGDCDSQTAGTHHHILSFLGSLDGAPVTSVRGKAEAESGQGYHLRLITVGAACQVAERPSSWEM